MKMWWIGFGTYFLAHIIWKFPPCKKLDVHSQWQWAMSHLISPILIHSWLQRVAWSAIKVQWQSKKERERLRRHSDSYEKKETLSEIGQRWDFIVSQLTWRFEVTVDISSRQDNEGHVTLPLYHGLHVLWILGSASPSIKVFSTTTQIECIHIEILGFS